MYSIQISINNTLFDYHLMKKIIPSKLETGVQRFLYKTVGERIPERVTPNQITLLGALGGLAGIVCAALSGWNRWFLIGTICGLVCHLVCYVPDHCACFCGSDSFSCRDFHGAGFALLMFTAMNYILHLDEFLFPRLGPIETHLFFAVLCIMGMTYHGSWVVTFCGFAYNPADILVLAGGVLMYYEMIRLQIQLFQRLNEYDKK